MWESETQKLKERNTEICSVIEKRRETQNFFWRNKGKKTRLIGRRREKRKTITRGENKITSLD